MIIWLGISLSKFYSWRERYGKANDHGIKVPRSTWLCEEEKEAIKEFAVMHPNEGYRRLTYMMIDRGIVCACCTSVYRVLSKAGLIGRWNLKPSLKGTGFHQPARAHAHWHVDISYVNIKGTFYYLCSVLDGYSRYMVHFDIRKSMEETDIQIVLQKAKERFAGVNPRIITDNGSQFIAKDFKEFIRISGMTHVKTSPYYPQSNGKVERWHKSVKNECIRKKVPLCLEDAQKIVEEYVNYYNDERLHSAIGYVTPKDKLYGNEEEIFRQRRMKLQEARDTRKAIWQRSREGILEKSYNKGVEYSYGSV